MKVTLAYSAAPRHVREWVVDMSPGACVQDAIRVCGVLNEFPELAKSSLELGLWGKRVSPDRQLDDNDRIEIYRALRVDPKVARRERFNRQGSKRAGLFAKSRIGAKAGY